MDPNDEEGDLQYVSELPLGTYAAVLAAVMLVVAHLADTGLYHPTREDELWASHSRTVLPENVGSLDDSSVISLIRAGCAFGCPQYRVQISGSGKVEYFGHHYVCAFGKHEAVVNARSVRRLFDAMIATGYFGFEWRKGDFALDHSSATSTLTHHGQSYRIYHYHGDLGAPRWLTAMEREIDRVAGTARWLPMPSTLSCPDPAGGRRVVTRSEPPAPQERR